MQQFALAMQLRYINNDLFGRQSVSPLIRRFSEGGTSQDSSDDSPVKRNQRIWHTELGIRPSVGVQRADPCLGMPVSLNTSSLSFVRNHIELFADTQDEASTGALRRFIRIPSGVGRGIFTPERK